MASLLPAIAPNTVLPFLGIREQDLPYKGKLNSQYSQRVSSNPFPLKGHGDDNDDDASHLLASLTGNTCVDDYVTNASVRKTWWKRGYPRHGKGPGFAERVTDFNVGCSSNQEGAQHKVELSLTPGLVQQGTFCCEKALDTTDLSFWMYTMSPNAKSNPEEESYSDVDSEEMEQRAGVEKVQERVVANDYEQVDDHIKREEFRARIKESLGFVRMRMEMLQDLSLGEALKEESAGGGDTSFMSSTSISLKRARRQAGILRTEEQAVRLQDLYQWFQNIGKTLGDDALGASSKSMLHNQLDRLRNLNIVKDLYGATQESKPTSISSPFECLKHVEHNVRDRLANLYQGKNFILSHQADIWANGKPELQASSDKEGMLHATMEKLQQMENAYEMLGTTILESLKEVERMEEDFHVLQSELVTNGCPLLTISNKKKKGKKSSHKGKKKGSSSDSDGMNTGSSRSESSSAQSSSRPTNAQAEVSSSGKNDSSALERPANNKGQNSKGSDERNIEADGRADSKKSPRAKKKSPRQKNEKTKGAKSEGKVDGTNQENNKRPDSVSAEASKPLQAPSPVAQAITFSEAAKEEGGQPLLSTSSGMGLNNNNNALNEGAMFSAPGVIEDVHIQAASLPSSDAKGQVGNEKPGSTELLRSCKGAGDLLGGENKLILPKTSFPVEDGRDVKPSDSASLQTLSKSKRKSRRLSSEVSKDEIVQTDDVAILSLEDCDVDALRICDYQAEDVKDLLENMKKMQKQLQFWRTKNWAEKHTGQGQTMPPPVYNRFIKVDASPDMGMLCYYNHRTGVCVMKNVSELDSTMQQSIMSLVAGPDHAV